jgi:hypothetical protein
VNDAIILKSTQVLADLKGAFGAFDESIGNALQRSTAEIDRTIEWLIERKNHWLREVENAEHALIAARSDLHSCEGSGYYDDDGDYVEPDCSSESEAVSEAERTLSRVTEKLETTKAWELKIQSAATDYHRVTSDYSHTVTDLSQERQRFLDVKLKQYDAAIAITQRSQLAGASNAAPAAKSNDILKQIAQIEVRGPESEQQILRNALGKFSATDLGVKLLGTLAELGTELLFALPDELERQGCFAIFDKTINRITLCHSLFERPPEIIAPHLAHEATHALWYRPSSIEQEYQAFKAQADLWVRIRGEVRDDQNDEVLMMIGQGESAFKDDLRGWSPYSGYPENA